MDGIRPLKKPCAIPVLQRLSGLSLTKAADELLLNHAKFMSEGEVFPRSDGKNSYFGSTFVTIDLKRMDMDLGAGEQVLSAFLEAVEHSVFFRLRLMRFARLEAERRCLPHLISEMFVQTEFRIDDMRLFIDISLECSLAAEEREQSSGQESR